MTTVLIGIDDTDNQTSRGTGYLARQLCIECINRGMKPLGVTRHQFLVDSRIPYTSHNSGACVAVGSAGGIENAAFAFDFVSKRAAEGSDPGVCLAVMSNVPAEVSEFGWAATSRVLDINQAIVLAGAVGIQLRPLGGTGQGVIGAVAAVGLRAEGNEGRFIDLPGLRELPAHVGEASFYNLGITLQHHGNGRRPAAGDCYETLGWVRPRLMQGRAVLIVEWSEKKDAWIPVDRKKSRPSLE